MSNLFRATFCFYFVKTTLLRVEACRSQVMSDVSGWTEPNSSAWFGSAVLLIALPKYKKYQFSWMLFEDDLETQETLLETSCSPLAVGLE